MRHLIGGAHHHPLLFTAQVYYELYNEIFDKLGLLDMYFNQLSKSGMPMEELYNKVQHAGHVLVRLYLLVTAGSVYIKSGQVPAKAVLLDLLEMSKGVQVRRPYRLLLPTRRCAHNYHTRLLVRAATLVLRSLPLAASPARPVFAILPSPEDEGQAAGCGVAVRRCVRVCGVHVRVI